MKSKGFTLIELMIVGAIIAILAAVAAPIFTGTATSTPAGTVCRGGYLFDFQSGRQIIGANGGGIQCNHAQPSAGVKTQ